MPTVMREVARLAAGAGGAIALQTLRDTAQGLVGLVGVDKQIVGEAGSAGVGRGALLTVGQLAVIRAVHAIDILGGRVGVLVLSGTAVDFLADVGFS